MFSLLARKLIAVIINCVKFKYLPYQIMSVVDSFNGRILAYNGTTFMVTTSV